MIYMKKFIFLGLAVMGIAILAVVNVNLSNKGSNVSGVTLKNLEALTQESGESGGGATCNCSSICGISTTCNKTVFRNGNWVENTGNVCCCGYTPGHVCHRVTNSYVECDGVRHHCN